MTIQELITYLQAKRDITASVVIETSPGDGRSYGRFIENGKPWPKETTFAIRPNGNVFDLAFFKTYHGPVERACDAVIYANLPAEKRRTMGYGPASPVAVDNGGHAKYTPVIDALDGKLRGGAPVIPVAAQKQPGVTLSAATGPSARVNALQPRSADVVDPFLEQTGVRNEYTAMRESMKSTLGRNRVYSRAEIGNERTAFRSRFASMIRAAAEQYKQPVPDDQHCATIRTIADSLSTEFKPILRGGRLRYGTAQKMLNLYLKYLWRLARIVEPPHCPVDSVVLGAGGIAGRWTESDSEEEYRCWIKHLRWKVHPLSLSQWELKIWLDAVTKPKLAGCC